MKNYNLLFQEEFHNSQNIDETFAELCDKKGLKEVKIEKVNDKNVSQLIINKENISIIATPLSKLLPVSLEICPDLEDDTRVGTCFTKALTVARHLGQDNTIVTGYC